MQSLRGALACALGFALCTLGAARAQSPDAFVEWVAEPAAPFAGQVVTLRIRVGLTPALRSDKLVPLYARELELPLRVEVPWLEAPVGARVIEGAARDRGPRLALGQGVAHAVGPDREVRPGYDVFEVTRQFVFEEPGSMQLGAPRLTYAFATRFEEDFLNGRRPVDTQESTLVGAQLDVPVRAVPTTGRPAGYEGLVVTGLRAQAVATPTTARVGDVIKVEVELAGQGDLARADVSDPDFDGFHVVGRIDTHGAGRRTIAWDLRVLDASVAAVPSLGFVAFDPVAEEFAVVRTAAIDLVLSPDADGRTRLEVAGADPRPEAGSPGEAAMPGRIPGENDIHDAPLDPEQIRERPWSPAWVPSAWEWLGLVIPVSVLGWIVAVFWIAFRSVFPVDAEQRRRRKAGLRARWALVAKDRSAADCLRELVAKWLDCEPAAVVDVDLESRLCATGLDPKLAHRVAEEIERGARERVSPGRDRQRHETDARDRVRGLIGELETAARMRTLAPRVGPAVMLMAVFACSAATATTQSVRGETNESQREFGRSVAEFSAALWREAFEGGLQAAHGRDPNTAAGSFFEPPKFTGSNREVVAHHFERANLAYRSGALGYAVQRYRLVLQRDPDVREARDNLELTLRRLGLEPPESAWDAWVAWVWGGAWFAFWTLQFVGLVLLCLPSRRRLAWRFVAGAAVALTIAYASQTLYRWPSAGETVVVPGVSLRAEPHADWVEGERVREGELVWILEYSPEWSRVETVAGAVGWVPTRALGLDDV